MENWDRFAEKKRSDAEELLYAAIALISAHTGKTKGTVYDELIAAALAVHPDETIVCGKCGAPSFELVQTGPRSVLCKVCNKETVFTEKVKLKKSEQAILDELVDKAKEGGWSATSAERRSPTRTPRSSGRSTVGRSRKQSGPVTTAPSQKVQSSSDTTGGSTTNEVSDE